MRKPLTRTRVIVLRQVRMLDPHNDTDIVTDVMISDGMITEFQQELPRGADVREIDVHGKWLFPGLVDMHVHLRVPGGQGSETLESGLKAAVAGGITTVAMMPNTNPAIDNPELMNELVEQCSVLNLADVVVVPCVTVGRNGKRLVALETLHESGARIFSDDGSPVYDDNLLREALERTDSFGGVIIEHPEDTRLTSGGVLNMGPVADELKVRGIPESAEYLDVRRSIDICESVGGRLHLTHLSCPGSVLLVKEAVRRGVRVTCDVTPHHLALREQDVFEFGTDAKMNPPLRSEDSRAALVSLVSKGSVGALASDHAPHSLEKKQTVLEEAAFGITGLETLLPIALEVLTGEGGIAPLAVLKLLSTGPASILGLNPPSLSPGRNCSFVLFDPEKEYTLEETGTFSLSRNTPFLRRRLRGRVIAVWKGDLIYREGIFAV